MATEKILNTRIQLKYDTLANWNASTFILKAGELAIVEVPTVEGATLQPIMFKVGDGHKTFGQLDWASAKAADVYAWAKKSGIDVIDNGTGSVVSDISWDSDSNSLVVSRIDVYTKTEADGKFQPVGNYKTQQTAYEKIGATTQTITKVEQNANGEVTVTYDDIVFPEAELLTVVEGNGIDVVQDGLTYTVNHENTSDVVNVTAADRTYVTGLTFDDFGHVTGVTTGTETVVDTNTAHAHVNGSGTVVSAAGGVDGEVAVNLNVAFELADGVIKLYDKSDDTKAAIATLDASEFIKDGMLEDVSYDEATNKLTFIWNTAAGEKTDVVELNDILDPYVFEAGAKLDVAVEGTKVTYSHEEVTAPTKSAGSGREYLTGVTTDGYGHITGFTTASETDQDLSSYKTKQAVVADPTASGSTLAFIDSVSQNENGEITATKKNVDLGEYAKTQDIGTGTLTLTGNDGLTGSASFGANQNTDTDFVVGIADSGVSTAKIADSAVTSAKVANGAIGAAHIKASADYAGEDAEVWVFNCGSATTII